MSDGTATTLQAPASGVTIRMYRQGLGDCFLLAFATGVPDKSYYVLIDCGVLLGTQDAEATMTRVAEDIEAATAGDIHLLIATHRHWDHISGFTQAAAVSSACGFTTCGFRGRKTRKTRWGASYAKDRSRRWWACAGR